MEELSLTGRSKHETPDELSTLSAIVMDGESVTVDNAAIHGKGRFERRITFVKKRDEVANGRRIGLVWVTLRKIEGEMGYHGLGASIAWIDADAGLGYKDLADQVNKMDAAMKGRVALEALTDQERGRLTSYLRDLRPELWMHANEQIRALDGAEGTAPQK